MKTSASRTAALVLIVLALSGCWDRSDYYATLADARDNRVFEKGWLPDLLPASAYELKVVTTVDISAGRGKFRFDPKDYGAFAARLSAYDGVMSEIDSDRKRIKRLLEKGYEPRTYSSHGSRWIFLCEPRESTCEFFVW